MPPPPPRPRCCPVAQYGLQPTPYPFQKGTDYLAWRDLVASGELTALVRDLPALQWLANTAPGCSVVVLQETLEPFDCEPLGAGAGRGCRAGKGRAAASQPAPTPPARHLCTSRPPGADGIAFHVNSSDALVQEWSRAVLRLQVCAWLRVRTLACRTACCCQCRRPALPHPSPDAAAPSAARPGTQESGTLEALRESWVVSQDSGCQTYSTVNRGAQPVSFQDLFGLWASARLPAAGVLWARACCACHMRPLSATECHCTHPSTAPPCPAPGHSGRGHCRGHPSDGGAALVPALPAREERGQRGHCAPQPRRGRAGRAHAPAAGRSRFPHGHAQGCAQDRAPRHPAAQRWQQERAARRQGDGGWAGQQKKWQRMGGGRPGERRIRTAQRAQQRSI